MAGLASLLSRRTTNPRAAGAVRRKEMLRRRGTPPPMWDAQGNPWPSGHGGTAPPVRIGGPPGGKYGGEVKGYQGGGRTGTPRAASFFRSSGDPRKLTELYKLKNQGRWPRPFIGSPPGGWQEGGPVGVAPEEVAMASEIYARATPEQQAQITGGGGGPGMMDEEAAIGEALAMAMGGGGGPPMGGMI